MTGNPGTAHADRYGLGIGCQVAAVALFAVMGALIKAVGDDYGTGQIIFFRSLPALIPLLFMLPGRGGWRALRTRRPDLQAFRVVFGIASMFCGFHAIAQMNLADYVAISFTAPLFGTLLSIPLIGERVGPWRLGACVVGFLGMLFMVGPISAQVSLYSLLAVASAFFYGLVMVAMRRLGGIDDSLATVFYFTASGVVVGGGVMMFDWVVPTPRDLTLLVLVGLSGGVAQIFMTTAFKFAPTSIVAPFDYTAMIWALFLGWIVFDTLPGGRSIIGAAIICGAGLFVLYRETVRGVGRPPTKRTSI